MTHIAIDCGSLCIDGQIVGPMPAPDFYSPEQRRQLTREVIRAVNAHNELVAALESAASLLETFAPWESQSERDAMTAIRAALAKAEQVQS